MTELRNAIERLPWGAKLFLVLFYDIYGALHRISTMDKVYTPLGILQFFTGGLFGILWLVDLITIIVHKDITVLTY